MSQWNEVGKEEGRSSSAAGCRSIELGQGGGEDAVLGSSRHLWPAITDSP